VSVSGGFDSSSIFCQAERMQRLGTSPARPVLGISYEGPAGSDADERRFLREIEREYGVAIDRFPMQPLQGLVTRATEQIQTIEAPFMDYMWGVTSELHRRASAGGAGVLLTGHWGDQVLFSSAYLVDLFGRLRWRRLARHLREYGRWLGPAETRVLAQRFVFNVGRRYVPPALVPLLKRLRYRLARRRVPMTSLFDEGFLRRSLDFAQQPVGLTKAFHTAHARSIYVEARSKYHVHCLEWNNKVGAHWGMDCAFPFLDRDLLQFLMAVPGDVQNRGGVPRALAREAMTGVLPDAIRQRSWKADFSTVVNEGVVSDVPVLRRHLHRGSQAVALGLIDPGRLAARLDDVGARGGRDCVASWELADVFGLEMWLQVFFARTAREAVESPA
jgi:asparagine synthase (glutamine-hydrolysing)